MYRRFYGLRERPFDLTPNPRYLVLTPGHREALSLFEYGIASRKGMTLLIGDALEFFLAGASAIQIGTAIFVDPGLPIRLVDDLAAWLAEEGFSSVDQIVGIANDGFRLGERHMLSAWEAAGA